MSPDSDLVQRFRADLEALAGRAPGRLGIAVSGGPDSLALLLLAEAAYPGQVEAATVDHGLRPESADEARFVTAICDSLGIPHAILDADSPIEGNLQSAARALRYRLLGDWAKARRIQWLLTAHHAEDQAETLAMRLARGAGLGGLSGVRARNGAVLRPLLGWRRAELTAIVAAAGIEPVEDPSNTNDRFDRARIRKQLAEAQWFDPIACARSAAALAEADGALDWAVGRLMDERVTRDGDALTFDTTGLPAELRRRILLRLLAPAGPPRGDALQRLLGLLEAGGTATLAGMKCEGGPRWRFTPAPPRR